MFPGHSDDCEPMAEVLNLQRKRNLGHEELALVFLCQFLDMGEQRPLLRSCDDGGGVDDDRSVHCVLLGQFPQNISIFESDHVHPTMLLI